MTLSSRCSEKCNRLVIEAFNENSISKFQFVKSTYGAIELLTRLAQCNEEGETPLVVAMKGKHFSVINELVTWISNKAVFKKECEPMVILIIEKLSHHIPIMELMDFLIIDLHGTSQNTNNSHWLEFIAQMFIKSTSFSRQDRIIALELIGASLMIVLGCNTFNNSCEVGLQCWKLAMTLRYSPSDGEALLPKIPAVSVPSAASSVVFRSAVEVMSVEELKLLQEDFVRYCLTLNHILRLPFIQRIKTQALLVIRRLSSQAVLGHPHWLYLKHLLGFGEYMMRIQLANYQGFSASSFKIMINTCHLVLEQANGFDPKMHPRKLIDVFVSTLELAFNFFIIILKRRKPPGSPEREELSYANFLTPTKFISTIQWEYFDNNEDRVRFTNLVHSFLVVLHYISPQMTNEEKHRLEEYYSNFVRNFFSPRTTTFLHVAVRRTMYIGENFPVLTTIKLILKLGGDPNAIDEKGQTPLHILAGKKSINLEEYLLVFQALVNAGTHLDTARDDGDTVLSILKKNVMQSKQGGSIVDPYFESLLNTVFPLSCYAARVIRRHGIPFDEDRLPFHLQGFVARHSGKDFTD